MASADDIKKSGRIGKGAWVGYGAVCLHAVIAALAFAAGIPSRSIAMIAFGFESALQTAAAALILPQYRSAEARPGREREIREQRRLFFLGVLFLLLALYILNESGSKLFYKEKSQPDGTGIILSAGAFMAINALTFLKFRAAGRVGNPVLHADAWKNGVRSHLALLLFLGLWLHNSYGFWWADPLAALLMLPFIIVEAWKAVDQSKGGPTRGNMKKI